MQARDIIRAVVSDSGSSITQASKDMGRSDLYLSSYASRGRIPSIELMAEIGDATGHDLLLRNRKTGREITIDPPRHAHDQNPGETQDD